MPVSFPSTPTVSQIFTAAGKEFIWTGSNWASKKPNNVIIDGGFSTTEIVDAQMYADGGSA